MGELDDAAVELGKASSIEPTNPLYPSNVARMFSDAGRWNDALPFAEKAAKLSFGNPEAQIFLHFVKEKAAAQRER